MSPHVKTGLLLVGLGAILGLFTYLSSLDAPPDLPLNDVHKLRFNTSGDLIGLGAGPLAKTDADGKPLARDKKSIEKRINTTCKGCHGSFDTPDLSQHACQQTGLCIPQKHPPKSTCIKCHRMPTPGSR